MMKLVALVFAFALIPAMAFAKDSSATLKVSGWHCEGCTAHTEGELKKLTGVKDVKTDLNAGTAQVTYDESKVTVAELEKAVTTAGYKVAK
jgi:copper chaperone CopZ